MATNKEIVENAYASFATGDVPAALGAMADDIQWTEADGFPLAGTYVGPQAVLEGVFMRLGEIGELWPSSNTSTPSRSASSADRRFPMMTSSCAPRAGSSCWGTGRPAPPASATSGWACGQRPVPQRGRGAAARDGAAPRELRASFQTGRRAAAGSGPPA